LPEKTIGSLKKKERTETLKQKVTEAENHYKNTLDKNSKNYRKKKKGGVKKSRNI
jgi:hypothetical protein